MSCLSHLPWFNLSNNIRWRIKAIKLIIMQFPQNVTWIWTWFSCAMGKVTYWISKELG
jgi:hypothetical protein